MFKIEKPDDEIVEKVGTTVIADLVKISLSDDPSKFCIMPRKYTEKDLERVKNMEIFEDDIFVITFPKCGTTWTEEMVWMLNNNLDYETSKNVRLTARFPFLEWGGIIHHLDVDRIEELKNLPRPRHINTHLPIFMLPDQLWTVKPKVIYVTRNPKDAAVSWFHHHRHFHQYQGTKADFIEAFSKDLMFFSPMNRHVLDFWKIRDEPNILFLFFEDMKRNLEQEVKKTMKFLNKDYSQDQIDKLCTHLSFDSIKDNKTVNKNEELRRFVTSVGGNYDPSEYTFIRKGQVGGYKDELTVEENEMMDKYGNYAEFEEYGFEYKY
ncbi:sulfotransferase 1C2-like isoform X2 [Chironomus tepperi]|uniref:sulfotransferase 1C2-like isoform X2 n=1 Tax=Chironomus tepperi TaxID=113505 RepID=UPI00391F6276